MPFEKKWNQITYNRRRWYFSQDLCMKVTLEEMDRKKVWKYEQVEMDIRVWGTTLEEAATSFIKRLVNIWDGIDADHYAPDGEIRRRYQLKEIVRRVERF